MTAILALGGNLPSDIGAPAATIGAAWAELRRCGLRVDRISGLYRTPCMPAGSGPDFVNAACTAEFDGTPQALLDICHRVERAFGRVRAQRWQARPLDIDLVAVDDLVLPDRETFLAWKDLGRDAQATTAPDRLILPHPRMQDRGFVLVPVCDVAPQWVHPVLALSARQMLDRLAPAERSAIGVVEQAPAGNGCL